MAGRVGAAGGIEGSVLETYGSPARGRHDGTREGDKDCVGSFQFTC